MKHWEERCPFLEKDVYASIRKHARRRTRSLRSGELSYRGSVALDVQEGFSVEAREGFPTLLNSALECI